MAKKNEVTLMWMCKTGKPTREGKPSKGWRRFPATYTVDENGIKVVNHGWVNDKGIKTEYPEGRYQLRRHVNGVPKYENIASQHPRDATVIAERARKAALGQKIADRSSRGLSVPTRKAAAAYVADLGAQQVSEAQQHARLVLKEFLPLCQSAPYVRFVTRDHLLAYHTALRKREQSARTIHNKDARVRSWLRWCGVDLKALRLPPKPSFEDPLPEIYTPSELTGILEAADPYMRIVIGLALKLGLREQEIQYAEWSDIDWHHSTFRVQGKKRLHWTFAVKDKAQRLLPIPTDLKAELKHWHKTRPDTQLIVGNENDRPEGHLLRKLKQLSVKADLHCKNCEGCARKPPECERWFLHKFRATFCTKMLRQTDPKTVMHLAGHSQLQTTLAYLSPASGEELQAHANAIDWTR